MAARRANQNRNGFVLWTTANRDYRLLLDFSFRIRVERVGLRAQTFLAGDSEP
jgi:hypothetical protein